MTPPERTWKRVFVATAKEMPEGDVLYELHGERSDGVDFRIQVIVLTLTPIKDIVLQVVNSLIQLDTYKDCDCVVGTPCIRHSLVHNPYDRGKLVKM